MMTPSQIEAGLGLPPLSLTVSTDSYGVATYAPPLSKEQAALVERASERGGFGVPPDSVTRRQLRRWLIKHGIALDTVRAMLSALPESDRSLAFIDFDDASTYESANPLVQRLAAQLGLEVAAVFLEAEQE